MKKEAVIKQADNIVSSASSWVIGEIEIQSFGR